MSKQRVFPLITAVATMLIAVPLLAAAPDGAAVYKAKCAMCHAADGSGNTPTGKTMKVRDLRSAEVQKLTDEQLEKAIESGKGKMPAYKGKIDDATIDALIKHIRELAKKK